MRQIVYDRFAILALNAGGAEEESAILQKHGLKHKLLLRHFEGEHELSYLVVCNYDETLRTVYRVANQYEQDSILVCNADRMCYLAHLRQDDIRLLRPHNQPIGQWLEVGSGQLSNDNDYTHDPSTGKYYQVG